MLGGASTERHLVADVVDVPSGERGQGAGLALVSFAKTCAIGVRGAACHRTGEGVSKDEARMVQKLGRLRPCSRKWLRLPCLR